MAITLSVVFILVLGHFQFQPKFGRSKKLILVQIWYWSNLYCGKIACSKIFWQQKILTIFLSTTCCQLNLQVQYIYYNSVQSFRATCLFTGHCSLLNIPSIILRPDKYNIYTGIQALYLSHIICIEQIHQFTSTYIKIKIGPNISSLEDWLWLISLHLKHV